MIDLYDPTTIREADSMAIGKFKVPGIVLMENAGLEASLCVQRLFPQAERFLILAGPGNNGVDGYVMARHFAIRGLLPIVLLAGAPEKIKGDALQNLEILKEMSTPIRITEEMTVEEITSLMSESHVVIDCLLGTGSKGSPQGEIRRIIELLEGRNNIVSIDIPSGINAETGEVYSPCVASVATITMLAMKTGLAAMPAAAKAGKIEIVSIGVPPHEVLPSLPCATLWEEEDAIATLPERKLDLHKGGRGTLLVVGGSEHYRGAPLLSALGALKSGCGVVIVASTDDVCREGISFLPEAVFHPMKRENPQDLLCWSERGTAAVVGPGLGRDSHGASLFECIWNEWRHPLLVDGDGIFWLNELKSYLKKRNDVIITPHEGEAARLLGLTAKDVASSRLYAAKELARQWGCVVLKGHGTVIDTISRTVIIREGGPELSVPGSGDILSGVIGTFLAQQISLLDSASLGVWIHGKAGQFLAERKGIDGILAREIAMGIPSVLCSLREKEKTKH